MRRGVPVRVRKYIPVYIDRQILEKRNDKDTSRGKTSLVQIGIELLDKSKYAIVETRG